MEIRPLDLNALSLLEVNDKLACKYFPYRYEACISRIDIDLGASVDAHLRIVVAVPGFSESNITDAMDVSWRNFKEGWMVIKDDAIYTNICSQEDAVQIAEIMSLVQGKPIDIRGVVVAIGRIQEQFANVGRACVEAARKMSDAVERFKGEYQREPAREYTERPARGHLFTFATNRTADERSTRLTWIDNRRRFEFKPGADRDPALESSPAAIIPVSDRCRDCSCYANSSYLRCAINPTGDIGDGCDYFEPRETKDED